MLARLRRARAALFVATLVGSIVISPLGAAESAEPELISTPNPQLTFDRLIPTSSVFSPQLRDNEGSAFVAGDDALWLADDRTDGLFEVDRTSGALRRKIPRSDFVFASRAGPGPSCSSASSSCAGLLRNNDLEAVAYDADADVLFVFSGGPGASGTWEPTVYRLTRDGNGRFQVRTWRDLPTEWTAAGWRAGDGLYVANRSTIRSYDYATDAFGAPFTVPDLTRITGVDFDAATGDLVAVNNQERLYRVRMDTKELRQGWNGLDLRPFGLLDTRAVEVIGDRVLISDGGDENVRPLSDPRSHAVFVLDVTEDTTAPNISIVTPPGGAVYGRNQVVNARFSCADTEGGTGLASCEGTVPSGQPIDTATLGSETFTVTATDVAGNERVVDRNYTVVAARPDARIRRGNGPLVGNDVYNASGAGQTRTGTAARGQSVTFFASIQNDSALTERIRLRGQRSTTWFTVVYRGPTGANITNAVTNGTYRTPNLASGASRRIKIVVTVRNQAPRGAIVARTLTARSTTNTEIADTVKFVTRRA